jgi:hypothetical protein
MVGVISVLFELGKVTGAQGLVLVFLRMEYVPLTD